MTAIANEVLKMVCSWCGTTLREGDDPTSEIVSHGICVSCATIHFPDHGAWPWHFPERAS